MLTGLFEKILSMSLLGCYVTLVVLLIRLLLTKCERKYSFWLWFVVFLNLCLPISIQGPFSLIPNQLTEYTEPQYFESENVHWVEMEQDVPADIAPDKEQLYLDYVATLEKDGVESQEPMAPATNVSNTPAETVTEVTNSERQFTSPTGTGRVNFNWQMVASLVWLVVLVAIWGISLYKGMALSRQLKKSREGQETAEEGIICVADINAPFLWGVWKPMIYLPANVEEEERTYIVAHEHYHKRRFDHITKLLVFAVVTLHWFNPLVWLAYALFVRDMEISCDEAVLSHTGEDIKKQYASSLLKYAAKQNGFMLSPLTFGEPSLKSRIQNVLRYRKRGIVVTIAAISVVILTACGLIIRPETEEQSGTNATQETNEQNEPDATATATPTTAPTAVPDTIYEDDVQIPEPVLAYFTEILQAREGGEEYTYDTLQERESGMEYHATTDLYLEDGGFCQIDWVKLSDELILKNLSFDLSKQLEEADMAHGSVREIFYDKEEDRAYLIVSSIADWGEGGPNAPEVTWLISFAPKESNNYTIYEYQYSSWFGECYRIGNRIFLHGGTGCAPYEIDLETKEGRLCAEEYTAAETAAYDSVQEYAKTHDVQPHVCWLAATAGYEDVTIFTGLVQETMDMPILARVYVVGWKGEILEAIVLNEETGEFILVKDFSGQVVTDSYTLAPSDGEDYNAIFAINGYQYHFRLDMDITNLFLRVGETMEEERYYGNVTVTPVYASNGDKEEQLGVVRGESVLDITSDALVEPQYAQGNVFCGKIGEVTENSVAVYLAEEVDRDTYTEFVNISEEAADYTFAEEVEFIMLDVNFRSAHTTFERFLEHTMRSADTVYYFVEKDGEIIQVWQPYIP